MVFSKNMYWGGHAAQRKAYILENLRNRTFQAAAYIITPARDENLFEIYHSAMLLTPGFDTDDVEIIGIGYGWHDTLMCVKQMTEDWLKQNGQGIGRMK